MQIKFVGMDPSMSNLGLVTGTIDAQTGAITVQRMDTIKTEPERDKMARKRVRKNSEDIERAKLLYRAAIVVASDTDIIFVEVPVGSQSSRAMASYGICIAVIAAVATLVPTIQVTPLEVKLVATGKRNATKAEMIAAMRQKYPGAPWPVRRLYDMEVISEGKAEHIADALAAVEAGMQTDEYLQAKQWMAMARREA